MNCISPYEFKTALSPFLALWENQVLIKKTALSPFLALWENQVLN